MFPKELNSKNFKKINQFPILKETQSTLILPIGVFASLGGIFQSTLRDHAQAFV